MPNIPPEAKEKLVKAYRAFYKMAIQQRSDRLTLDQVKAIGQKVMDELFEKAFTKLSVREDERAERKKEMEDLIRKECSDLLSDTAVEFTGEAFEEKDSKERGLFARFFRSAKQ